MNNIKVNFPRWASYNVAVEHLIRDGLDCEYVYGPPITKRTLELGSKYAPDYVCTPFKYNLGSYIEAIENGANTLIQIGGACRLNYYGEVHEQILKDLGYNVKFVNMANAKLAKPLTFYDEFKKINPNLNLAKITQATLVAVKMVDYLDKIEDYIRENVGFEVVEGSFDNLHKEFLEDLRHVKDKKELNVIYKLYLRKFKNLEINKPKNPLKVGIIGEYYTIMDDYSNHFIEKELAKKGIIVKRWMNLSNSIFHNEKEEEVKKKIRKYAKFNMGATAMFTIQKAIEYAKDGCDGLIHLKSFGCTPEIDTMPVLQRISEDYKIPIIYFSFDTQTSDVGINTRIEAFYDMMMMRKEKVK